MRVRNSVMKGVGIFWELIWIRSRNVEMWGDVNRPILRGQGVRVGRMRDREVQRVPLPFVPVTWMVERLWDGEDRKASNLRMFVGVRSGMGRFLRSCYFFRFW